MITTDKHFGMVKTVIMVGADPHRQGFGTVERVMMVGTDPHKDLEWLSR